MAYQVLARLEPEDLKCWQQFSAELYALQYNPDAFTKEESIDICRQKYELGMELQTKYHLPEDEDWQVNPNSGVVLIED